MAIDYERVVTISAKDRRFRYTERDAMLYALSVGMGRDPLDEAELPFVYDGRGLLRAVPTMAVVLASTGLIRETGVDFTKILHGEQRLVLNRPLPVADELIAESCVRDVYDKGPGRGALLLLETKVRSASDGGDLFSFVMTIFARGDGGFGGPAGSGPKPHVIPERKPEQVVTLATRPDSALLYRLNGDGNPLHADPKVAERAGFERPILHGLCTYGIACRAVLKAVCGYDPTRIKTFDARFTGPVFPGEEIETRIWRDGDVVSFRCVVPSRDIIVVDNGRCAIVGAEK